MTKIYTQNLCIYHTPQYGNMTADTTLGSYSGTENSRLEKSYIPYERVLNFFFY
jgi:hypothetical protein